jgi:hypothetical protein
MGSKLFVPGMFRPLYGHPQMTERVVRVDTLQIHGGNGL